MPGSSALYLAETFKTRAGTEWRRHLQAGKLTFSVLAAIDEEANDLQVLANDMIINVEGHNSGRGQTINSLFWVDGSNKVPTHVVPELGASGADILRGLGYSEDNIIALSAKGVI